MEISAAWGSAAWGLGVFAFSAVPVKHNPIHVREKRLVWLFWIIFTEMVSNGMMFLVTMKNLLFVKITLAIWTLLVKLSQTSKYLEQLKKNNIYSKYHWYQLWLYAQSNLFITKSKPSHILIPQIKPLSFVFLTLFFGI